MQRGAVGWRQVQRREQLGCPAPEPEALPPARSRAQPAVRCAAGASCAQALLHSSHMFAEAKHSFASHGVLVDNPRVDLGERAGGRVGGLLVWG